MLRAREYKVNMMAVMGRVGVPGTRFADSGEITELELTKIAAVAGLVTAPGKSMNVHEPKKMPLLAGVNQLYAEIGINPRGNRRKTKENKETKQKEPTRGRRKRRREKKKRDREKHLFLWKIGSGIRREKQEKRGRKESLGVKGRGKK